MPHKRRAILIKSYDHNVYAMNATNGIQLWNYTTSGAIASSPALVNQVVYIGSSDHNLYAINSTNGAKLWNYTTDNAVSSSPAIDRGVVYVGSGNNVYALSSSSTSSPSLNQEALYGIGAAVAIIVIVAVVFVLRKSRNKK